MTDKWSFFILSHIPSQVRKKADQNYEPYNEMECFAVDYTRLLNKWMFSPHLK